MTDFFSLGLLYSAIEILGIVTAVHAVMSVRTSQGAIAWIFPLVLFPLITLPLYWIFGRNKFQGYFVARREGETAVQKSVTEGIREFRKRFPASLSEAESRFLVCEKLAGFPFSSGNSVELLIDGQQTFDAIFAGIDSAKDYVLAEFFIIHDDQLGREFKNRLITKARQGVKVLLLYDEIGCHKLRRRYLAELTDAGVHVRKFHSTRGFYNRFQLNFRNHRKIVVVDGHQAYVGGLNVGDEYMGRGKKFGLWRDTHVSLRGPAVAGVQLAFAEDWHWATSETDLQLNWEMERSEGHHCNVVVLPTGPADELESCGLFFTHIIHAARQRVWIASPYFVPTDEVVKALKIAALRDVDVRILLPAKADHLLVYLSSFSFVAESEPAGVKFFRYQPGFLHQKVVLVDDDFAAVGTANLDNRSFRLNFEITIGVADIEFAAKVERMLAKDFANSQLETGEAFRRRPFWFRFAVRLARLMAPVQ